MRPGYTQYNRKLPSKVIQDFQIAVIKNNDGREPEVLIKLLKYYKKYGIPGK